MYTTTIKGTGSYVPDNKVPNSTMETLVDTSDEWIQTRTGIEFRHITVHENTSDLAYEAAIRAMDDAGIKAEALDMIIVATVSGDYVFPGVSQLLQKRLGCNAIPAFDLNAACTGFVYALDLANGMIASGKYENILIIGTEALSKLTDFKDRNTCVLFGDGAGAFVLSRSNEVGVRSVITHSDGDTAGYLKLEGYPVKKNYETEQRELPFIKMDGTEIFKFATTVFPSVIKELLDDAELTLENLDLIVAHQANKRIIDKSAKVLGYPKEKMYMNIARYGNTSAASIPIAVDEAIKHGKLKRGDTFAIAAFGGGLTWGGAIIDY
ncbi:MAG: beta-ketoacyl-ACP synthase III, partial [Bacillota bacterium]